MTDSPLRKEQKRKAAATYRKNNPAFNMYHNAKNRAKRKGLKFDLTKDYLNSIMTDKCPVLGIQLEFGGHNRETSPSLDRIIPELGYVKGNVVIISNKANAIKNSASVSEILQVAQWLEEQLSTTTGELSQDMNKQQKR